MKDKSNNDFVNASGFGIPVNLIRYYRIYNYSGTPKIYVKLQDGTELGIECNRLDVIEFVKQMNLYRKIKMSDKDIETYVNRFV